MDGGAQWATVHRVAKSQTWLNDFTFTLDRKEIKPINPKGNQHWILFGRMVAKARALILWPPDMQNQHIRKHSDAGKDLRQEKGATEDELAGWHHWLEGHEFEQALEVVDGQVRLTCCSPWGCKESDMTEWLKWTELFNNLSNEFYGVPILWMFHHVKQLGKVYLPASKWIS